MTLTCSYCRAPEGVTIWRLPRSGNWSGGLDHRYDKHGVEVMLWRNKHGVACDPPKSVRLAQTVTVQLQPYDGDLVCGWCRGRFAVQGSLDV